MKIIVSPSRAVFLLGTLISGMLSACGGGSSAVSATELAVASSPESRASTATVAYSPIAGALTDIRIENSGSADQSNVPVTFGQVFAQGDIPASYSVAGKLSDGTTVPLQVDVKATHSDGSLRHGIISAVLPQLAVGQIQTIGLVKVAAPSRSPVVFSPAELTNAGFTASVNVNIGGQIYSASADALLKSGKYTTWLTGSVANEWLVSAPLQTAQGIAHPHLTARFAIRSFNLRNKAKVDVTIENNWAYESGPQNFTYDAQVLVGGRTVYSKSALTHYHHARWRKTFWWGAEPLVDVKHNTAYLIASKALPNYDTSITISSTGLNNLDSKWSASSSGPMGPGIVMTSMPTAGGRPDIGPLPQWAAMYLLSMDRRAKNVTLGVGDLAGSWPIHYRDKKTDRPVSLADYPYMTLLGHPSDTINPATGKSESFPACGGDCSTTPYNYNPDGNHQPSMAYMPYLVTGDYYYLEELQFWANWNMIQANPYYRDFSKGLGKWNEIRGQAWTLRTLGQVAYITPDSHPMKQYFVDRVGYNLDFYNTTFTDGNPNQLGVLDGTKSPDPIQYTTPAGAQTGIATWMDDFFTWSVGHLDELGFTKAKPLLAWKAKFPVGRMTAPGYCWIDGAVYSLAVRSSATSPLFSTFSEAYLATMRNSDGTPMINSTGAKYLDQACGSQAQADWRTQADKDAKTTRPAWVAGEMTGYANFAEGYPSNMQPALAVAATSGISNAQTAWSIFINRSVKPDYSTEPQWAIVPRN